MKRLVVSDIHGSWYYARQLKKIKEEEKPDTITLLGDLYYHGPRNPLPKEYDPMKVAQLLNEWKDIILCVRGNCDALVDEMISQFKMEESISLEINGKTFLFTHGHKNNIEHIPKGIDVIVYGHFHTGFIQEKEGILCVNAGSLSLPKENTKNSYVIITEQDILLKDIEGNVIQNKKWIVS